MSPIESIYTTVTDGYTPVTCGEGMTRVVYIGANNGNYLGDVEVFDDPISRFFAWLFGKSVIVNFDGQEHSINKKGFTRLLQDFNLKDKIQDIRDHCVFKDMIKNAEIPNGKTKMSEMIKYSDVRFRMREELAKAISKGDIQGVKSLIGKGADVDAPYYERQFKDSKDVCCRDDVTRSLDFSKSYTFTAHYASPILHAARAGNETICQLLKDAGANLNTEGREYDCIRYRTDNDDGGTLKLHRSILMSTYNLEKNQLDVIHKVPDPSAPPKEIK